MFLKKKKEWYIFVLQSVNAFHAGTDSKIYTQYLSRNCTKLILHERILLCTGGYKGGSRIFV
jgi:hypothetical protein